MAVLDTASHGRRRPKALGMPPPVAWANRRGRREALPMTHIACGLPPARRIARAISMGQ